MKSLLDVNALVAFGIREHEFHTRVANWIEAKRSEEGLELTSCSITELGFIRVAGAYGFRTAAKQVTDGHLLQLAKANGAVLATLDQRIPGAYLIPAKS